METTDNYMQLETTIVGVLKGIYDPEIPVNIYDLGLIYEINTKDEGKVEVIMTLTAPNCPVADSILYEVKEKVEKVEGVSACDVTLVFDPPWDQSMLSDEAKLELGFYKKEAGQTGMATDNALPIVLPQSNPTVLLGSICAFKSFQNHYLNFSRNRGLAAHRENVSAPLSRNLCV